MGFLHEKAGPCSDISCHFKAEIAYFAVRSRGISLCVLCAACGNLHKYGRYGKYSKYSKYVHGETCRDEHHGTHGYASSRNKDHRSHGYAVTCPNPNTGKPPGVYPRQRGGRNCHGG